MRHQRDLAEPRRARIGFDQRAQHRLALVGVELDDASVFEAQPEALDQRAPVTERLGRPHRAVDTVLVRHRKDFFGGQVRREGDPRRVVRAAANPQMIVRQPDRERRARPRVAQHSIALLIEVLRAVVQFLQVGFPRGHRIGTLEPA